MFCFFIFLSYNKSTNAQEEKNMTHTKKKILTLIAATGIVLAGCNAKASEENNQTVDLIQLEMSNEEFSSLYTEKIYSKLADLSQNEMENLLTSAGKSDTEEAYLWGINLKKTNQEIQKELDALKKGKESVFNESQNNVLTSTQNLVDSLNKMVAISEKKEVDHKGYQTAISEVNSQIHIVNEFLTSQGYKIGEN